MSLVGGATGGGLVGAAPRPASGTWVKPAPVAGTVEGGMSGAAGGAVVGGGGSVAAVIAPADMEFAPAAAGAPVDIPFVKDCARDCGDKGGADAAGVETPGIDGPPTPTAGAPGWRGEGAGVKPVGDAGAPGSPRIAPPNVVSPGEGVGATTAEVEEPWDARAPPTVDDGGGSGAISLGADASCRAKPNVDDSGGVCGGESRSFWVIGSVGGGPSMSAPS